MPKLSAPIHHLKRLAKRIARAESIPLHRALDRLAKGEGYANWSSLAARNSPQADAKALLRQFAPGDFAVIGGRPGQGKTRLGLSLLEAAVRDGRRAVFYTLEYTAEEAGKLIGQLAPVNTGRPRIEVETSDLISSHFIIDHLRKTEPKTVAVVDYMQILDQCRSKPVLSDQLAELRAFVRQTGIIVLLLSQIDRTFDPEHQVIPNMGDLRLPNPIPARIFTKACFVHNGDVRIQSLN